MDAYVAREPIFNKKQKLLGYELLFRDGLTGSFPGIDGDTATSKLLSNSFLAMGIDQIAGGKKAFINFTQDLLLQKVPTMFPVERIVVEVLEDVNAENGVVQACREMADAGYVIALDDFLYRSELKPLIALSKIIKVDFRLTSSTDLEACIRELSPYPVKLLAEKVETHEEFELGLGLGFDYFQGYFFGKPQILKARDVAPSKIPLLQLMAEANKQGFSFEELEKLVSRDVSISYKLLRYMNSAYFRRAKEISSIRQAIVLLGEKGIRRFVSLIIMAKLASDKPEELVRMSIIRARLCERMGDLARSGVESSELFTLGLFSLIDAILDAAMDKLMATLPLSEAIKSALVGGTGELTPFLDLVLAYETGDWNSVSRVSSGLRLDEKLIPGMYLDAVGWADSLSSI